MMDLKMEVYTPGLELVGMLNEWQSIIWEEKAFTAGSFSLNAPITNETIQLLVADNVLWIEGDTAGIIEHRELESGDSGPYITVKGRLLTCILDFRILWGLYDLSGQPADIMHRLVEDCCINPTRGDPESRKIPGLIRLNVPSGGESIQLQKTGGSLLDGLELLGRAYGIAFGVRFNAEIPRMEFWTRYGVNRSVNQTVNDPVFYSTELDDVLASQYSYDSSQYRNIALVAGEGDGSDRKTVVVEEDVPAPPTPPEPPVTETYTITLLVDPAGGGTASGGGAIKSGTSITVSASPSDEYTFVEWRENGVMVSTSKDYTFTVNGDRTLTAVFAAIIPVYTITATVDPSGSGNVTGTGQYEDGATVNLKATANDGYNFQDWKEGGETVHSEPNYSFTAEKNRDLVAAFAEVPSSRLPTGYTEVEYIQSSGTQYIDTGMKPISSTKINMDVEPTADANSTVKYFFFSTYSPTSGNRYAFYAQWYSTGIRCALGSYSTLSATVISSDVTKRRVFIQMDASTKTASVDGSSKSFSNNSFSTSMGNIFLLSGTTVSSRIPAKFYSCQIYDNNGLVRDYVPCINPSGQVGLYDLVGKMFYGNSGTDTFTAGHAV